MKERVYLHWVTVNVQSFANPHIAIYGPGQDNFIRHQKLTSSRNEPVLLLEKSDSWQLRVRDFAFLFSRQILTSLLCFLYMPHYRLNKSIRSKLFSFKVLFKPWIPSLLIQCQHWSSIKKRKINSIYSSISSKLFILEVHKGSSLIDPVFLYVET